MMLEEFAQFLIEQRKKKDLTQKEFAKKVGVSTAAVSKWERGLCLPEVSRFEDIAKVLELNIIELIQCKEGETSSKVFNGILTETINISERQYKSKSRKSMVLILVIAIVCFCLYFFPVYRIFKVWYPSFYTTGEITKLASIGSPEDRDRARLFVAKADKAFSDLTTPEKELYDKYGLLSRYAPGGDIGGKSETHSLKLWSAHFGDDSYGYVWIWYTNEVKDEKNEVIQGSYDIPSLWIFEKDEEGVWKIIDIKEYP